MKVYEIITFMVILFGHTDDFRVTKIVEFRWSHCCQIAICEIFQELLH